MKVLPISDNNISSKGKNKQEDVEAMESLVEYLSKVNPFEVNDKFLRQRKTKFLDYLFVPDERYVDIENKLVKAEG